MSTKIEWATETWNPITGCTPISEGCQNCFAKRMANRLKGRCGYDKDNPFNVTLHPDRLGQPLRWKKPRRVFVCSMGDLFHPDVRDEWIDQIFWQMGRVARWHTYLVLTKRPERMRDWLNKAYNENAPYRNVWLGVTCENQARADERIPVLLQTPAAVRFVSVEPMLGPVDLTDICTAKTADYSEHVNTLSLEEWTEEEARREFGDNYSPPLDWVICGTESGPKRRPAQIERIRSLKNQCVSSGVPFFLKQMEVDGKLVKMPELDGQKWNEYPGVRA